VAVACGLGAAALFAAGTTLQYRAAKPAPYREGVYDEPRRHSTWRATINSPYWLSGTTLLGAGVGLHALALHEGPLTLVQPLLVAAVLFALPASRYAGGPKIGAADMRWAAVLVAGLATFLVTATPASQPARDIDTGPALGAFGLSVVGVVICVLLARRGRDHAPATGYGAAAGIALAGSAALMKACTDLATKGLPTLVGSWQLYALIAVGGSALALSQIAYRAGPMTAGLPAINVVNPLVSVIIGWAVFDETFRTSGSAVALEVISLTAALTATMALSRRSAVSAELAGERADGSGPSVLPGPAGSRNPSTSPRPHPAGEAVT
jgi:hypothetical protein